MTDSATESNILLDMREQVPGCCNSSDHDHDVVMPSTPALVSNRRSLVDTFGVAPSPRRRPCARLAQPRPGPPSSGRLRQPRPGPPSSGRLRHWRSLGQAHRPVAGYGNVQANVIILYIYARIL